MQRKAEKYAALFVPMDTRTPEGPLRHRCKHTAPPSCTPVGQRPYLGGVQELHPASTIPGELVLRDFSEAWSDYADLAFAMMIGVIVSRSAFFRDFWRVR